MGKKRKGNYGHPIDEETRKRISETVKNRLNESFTINDVDNLFEDLRQYNLNISKLPFQLNSIKNCRKSFFDIYIYKRNRD